MHEPDEDEGIFGEDQAVSQAHMRSQVKSVDPSVNIAADQFDSFEIGYGTSHSSRQVWSSTAEGVSFHELPEQAGTKAYQQANAQLMLAIMRSQIFALCPCF